MSSAVCVLKGVPIITTGSLKSRKNGNPGMPIFTGCVYFHDTGGLKCISSIEKKSIGGKLSVRCIEVVRFSEGPLLGVLQYFSLVRQSIDECM